MELFDLVGVGCLHVYCASISSLAESYAVTLAAHGLTCLVWVVWVMVCYIGGVDELDILAASPLGSIADSLSGALYLLLKRRFPCPLVLEWGRDVDGGRNTICWMVWRVVRVLWHIVCYLTRRLVVSYLHLVDAVLQLLHLSLCCCCTLCVANNRFCDGRFTHCGFCGIGCRPINFLA